LDATTSFQFFPSCSLVYVEEASYLEMPEPAFNSFPVAANRCQRLCARAQTFNSFPVAAERVFTEYGEWSVDAPAVILSILSQLQPSLFAYASAPCSVGLAFQFFPSCSPRRSEEGETDPRHRLLSILSQLQLGDGDLHRAARGDAFQFFPSCSFALEIHGWDDIALNVLAFNSFPVAAISLRNLSRA